MDHFLGYFLPRLAERVPECAAIVEAIAEGYKICHPVRLDGKYGAFQDVIGDGGRYFPHPSRNPLIYANSCPAIRNHTPLGSLTTPPTYTYNHNIVYETTDVNTGRSKANEVEINITALRRNMQHALSSLESSEYADILGLLNTSSMTRVCTALFSLLGKALLNETSVIKLKKTVYIIVINENEIAYLDFRLANHFTNSAQMLKWDSGHNITGEERKPAEHHLALVLNDVEYRTKHNYNESKPGSHFDPTPIINRVEIIVDLNAFYNSPKNATLLLQALYNIVKRDSFDDAEIEGIMDSSLNSKAEGDVKPVEVKVVQKAFLPDRRDFMGARNAQDITPDETHTKED